MPALCALTLAALVAASPPAKPKLAVIDIHAQAGVPPDLAATLTSATAAAVRARATDYAVIDADEIRALFALQKQRQQLGCQDASCLAELGGDLGAKELLTGTLGRVGDTYLLTLRRVDVRRAQVTHEASERIPTSKEAALLTAVDHLTRTLFTTGTDVAFAPQVTDSAPAPRSHLLSFALMGTAVAALAVGAISTGEVLSFQSASNSAENAIALGSVSPVAASDLLARQHQAQTLWQPLAVVTFSAAALALGGAVLTW